MLKYQFYLSRLNVGIVLLVFYADRLVKPAASDCLGLHRLYMPLVSFCCLWYFGSKHCSCVNETPQYNFEFNLEWLLN